MLRPVVDLNKLSRILSNIGRELKGARPKKNDYMPLSFQGFGAMASIVMVLILAAAQGIEYIKTHRGHH
jgi:hypothetical protein